MATETTGVDRLNETVKALQNGLTALPLSAAMDNTEAWQQEFLQSGIPGLQDIAREIGTLQSLLTASKLNGPAIGSSLSLLGTQTNQHAFQAPADQQKALRALGDLLLRLAGDLQAVKGK
ncbi:hypothetical protein SAMN02745146_2430 [Hymenobacter daecheongensis DSM 21074]|uniref:Uncharacterized protein n=1 Tax=Hymenobacter daecheongensis DSM 21074 TaxID=1121955 RepID=A0A1M6GX71_9BACT|nr:hypothetical protein [Hymenobacter daecheongensis]SHJ14539.1 hypothetical protein SAMN02745146_2430 [Hymenobacter daecheongensis DSM 21074]